MTADDQPDGIGPGHADMAARILQRVVGGAGSTPLRSLEAAKGLSDWIDPDTAIAELIDASADLVRHPGLVQHTYRFANDAILTLQMRPVTDGVELTGLFEPVDHEAQPVGSGADRWACQVEAPDRDPLICSLDRGTFAGTWRSFGLFRVTLESGPMRLRTPWIDNPPTAEPADLDEPASLDVPDTD